MDGGLPYDDSPMEQDDPLDRPLDDFAFAHDATMPSTPLSAMFGAPPTTSRDRGVIPEHIANLLGRMGRNKVYLAEESSGIMHHDAEERLRRDPRLAKLAEELDSQDPTAWLDAISETTPARIRPNALFVSSELIKHLSTAKVFSWASQAGASPMGIEWLNDATLILLFATPAAALLGLSMLAKAGFDPTEGDDPLLERAAHGIPPSLLPQSEPDHTIKEDAKGEEAAEAADAREAEAESSGIRRRGRGKFAAGGGGFDLEPLAQPITPLFAEGVNPHARVTIRYAVDSDHVQRRGARDSEWYARHGRGAGKEVSRRAPRDALELKDRVGSSGEGRDFSRRIGRERVAPYRRPKVSDLDAELDAMAAGRAAGDDMPTTPGSAGERRPRRGNNRREQRERANADDLDRELDEMFAARASE